MPLNEYLESWSLLTWLYHVGIKHGNRKSAIYRWYVHPLIGDFPLLCLITGGYIQGAFLLTMPPTRPWLCLLTCHEMPWIGVHPHFQTHPNCPNHIVGYIANYIILYIYILCPYDIPWNRSLGVLSQWVCLTITGHPTNDFLVKWLNFDDPMSVGFP